MKRLFTLMLIFLGLLTACGGDGELRELRQLGRALGLDLSAGVLVRYEYSHCGFHVYGLTAAEVEI